jgi:hypothetical protein
MTDCTRFATRSAARSIRLLSLFATTLGLGLVLAPRPAEAAPGVSVGGKVGTQGAQGNASSTGKKTGFQWPERIVAGNAITALLPVQIGFTAYLPRVRLGFQYERQLVKSHWVYIGVAGLFDRADWQNFRLGDCGLGNASGVCNRGTVAGFDVYAGYAHKWYLRERPWLVPIARGANRRRLVEVPGRHRRLAPAVARVELDAQPARRRRRAHLPDRQPRPRRRRESRPRPHALDRRAAGRAADQEQQASCSAWSCCRWWSSTGSRSAAFARRVKTLIAAGRGSC